MAEIIADRIQETTSTSGTGSLALGGASPRYRSFGSVMATGDTCRYVIDDPVTNAWEVGVGTYSSAGPALARTTVESSSNANALVSLAGSAGTTVYLDVSAAKVGTFGLTPPNYPAATSGDLLGTTALTVWNGTAMRSMSLTQWSAFLGLPVSPAVISAAFFVSPTGSDSNAGTQAAPFLTLEKARSARAASSSTTAIYVRGGTYALTSTLTLTAGTDNNAMFLAYPGEQPLITNGASLTTLLTCAASNVLLQGLSFSGEQAATDKLAVEMHGGNGCRVIACRFYNNNSGLLLAGATNAVVSGNQFDGIGFCAIEVKDGANSALIDSNLITGVTNTETTGGGVYVHGCNDVVVSHNLIQNCGGSGISICNFDGPAAPVYTLNLRCLILKNALRNCCMVSSDAGAIYLVGRAEAATYHVVDGNLVDGVASSHSSPHALGIYLDDEVCYVTVRNNVVRGIKGCNICQIHGGQYNLVANNVFDMSASGCQGFLFQGRDYASGTITSANNTVTRNLFIGSTAPFVADFNSMLGYGGGSRTIAGNLYPPGTTFTTNSTDSAPLYGDPVFVNAPGGIYTPTGLAASQIGFQPIDQSSIGLQPQTATWYSLPAVATPAPAANLLPATLRAEGARSVAPISLFAMNIASLSFGSAIPGTPGTDYFVPDHTYVDYWVGKGYNGFRLAFLWERLQTSLNGALAATYLGYLTDFVGYAATRGATVVLDPHNYGSYGSNLIGSTAVPNSAFADLWSRIATAFKGYSNVRFGLMNEPQQSSLSAWITSCNAAITAIRATGAMQRVIVPMAIGDQLDWLRVANGTNSLAAAIVDSANNTGFECHRYWDSGFSGTLPVAPGAIYDPQICLAGATGWARKFGYKLFLGETGFDSSPAGLLAMQNCLTYLQKNSDAWDGLALWGGGPAWSDSYVYKMEPIGGKDAPMVAVSQRFLPGGSEYGVARPIPGPKLVIAATPSFTATADPIVAQAMSGGAAYYDGIYLYKSSLTIACRFAYTAVAAYLVFLGRDGGGSLMTEVDGKNLKASFRTNNGNNYVRLDSGMDCSDGVVRYALLCLDQTGGRLYIDGVLKASDTSGPWSPDTNNNIFGIRSDGSTTNSNTSVLREVVVYDHALDTAGASLLPSYEPLTGSEPGLVMYAPLNGDLRTYC